MRHLHTLPQANTPLPGYTTCLSQTGRILQYDWRTLSSLCATTNTLSNFENGQHALYLIPPLPQPSTLHSSHHQQFLLPPNPQYTLQGIQNQTFSLFVLLVIFAAHVKLIMARFTEKSYSFRSPGAFISDLASDDWVVSMISNTMAEIQSQIVLAVPWYYALGAWRKKLS